MKVNINTGYNIGDKIKLSLKVTPKEYLTFESTVNGIHIYAREDGIFEIRYSLSYTTPELPSAFDSFIQKVCIEQYFPEEQISEGVYTID